MRISAPQLIVTLCLYLSLMRGTNIGLFYPADEFSLADIDYTFQTLSNYILLLGVVAYFFLGDNYVFLREKLTLAAWPILLGLGALSLGLSVNKLESIKFVVAVGAISLPSLLYLREYGAEALLRALAWFAVGMAFLNIAYVFLFPEYGVMTGNHYGRWRGMFEHKNIAGPYFAVSFFVILHQLRLRASVNAILQLAAMAICVIFAVKAESSTAIVAFAGLALIYPLMMFLYRVRAGDRIVLMLVTSATLLLIFTTLGPVIMQAFFEATGKDATLTGRTGIWSAVFDLVRQRPMQGFGPGMSERPDFMVRIQDDVGWNAKSTHNSYLDLLIGFGYPLTILFLFFVFKTWLSSFMDRVGEKSSLRLYAMASSLVFIILCIGFAGSSALLSRSVFWLMLMIGLAILSTLRRNGPKEA